MAEPVAYHEREQAIPARKERKALREQLLGEDASRALAFQTVAVKHFGAEAGIFIRQLLYRDGTGKDGNFWIYKSMAEWQEETGLGRKAQEKARKRLVGAGVMDEEKRLAPDHRQTWHFRVNPWKLMEVLGDDLPHAKVKPGVYTVPLTEQRPCPLNGAGTMPARGTGYTEDYPEEDTEVEVLLKEKQEKEKAADASDPWPDGEIDFGYGDPRNGFLLDAEGRADRDAAEARNAAATTSSPDQRKQAQKSAGDKRAGKPSPTSKRSQAHGGTSTALLHQQSGMAPQKAQKQADLKAEVDALNAKKERGHPSDPVTATLQADIAKAEAEVDALISAMADRRTPTDKKDFARFRGAQRRLDDLNRKLDDHRKAPQDRAQATDSDSGPGPHRDDAKPLAGILAAEHFDF